jgi:hypothetical protein
MSEPDGAKLFVCAGKICCGLDRRAGSEDLDDELRGDRR